MKKLTLSIFAMAMVSVSYGYDESTITEVDWSKLASGSTYTVPAGETNLVMETDIAFVNALEEIVFGDSKSAILFTSTTAPAVLFSGYGTVVKEGAADWTMSKVQTDKNFKGNWDIAEGTVRVGQIGGTEDNGLFPGRIWSWRHCYVRKGATLVYDVAATFSYVSFHLSGVLWVKCAANTTSFQHFVIEDDAATIRQDSGGYIWFSRPSDDGEPALDLNGHKLTCKLDHNIYNHKGTVQGPGTLRLENEGTAEQYFVVRNRSVSGFADPSVVVELGDKTGVLTEDHPSEPQQAKMVVEGAAYLRHHHNTSSVPECPAEGEESGLVWAGPIELKNPASTLDVDYVPISGDAYLSHMELRGLISGPGSLGFMRIGSKGVYSITCPTNAFSGNVIIGGGTEKVVLAESGSLGDATVKFAGGTLEVAGAAAARSFASIVVDSGVGKLVVKEGAEVEVSAVSQTAGSLAITAEKDAVLKFPGLAVGPAPSWMTINGESAEIQSDGAVTRVQNRWKEAVSGVWSSAANWSHGVVPDGSELTTISVPGDYIVTVSNAVLLGAFEQTCATLDVHAAMTFGVAPVFGAGSVARFGDGASLVTTTGLVTGGGEVVIADGAVLKPADDKSIELKSDADGALSVTLTNGASFTVGANYNLNVGGIASGGSVLLDYSTDEMSPAPMQVAVGRGSGLAELDVRAGMVRAGNKGFEIGQSPGSGPETGTGVVKVVGGTLYAGPKAHNWNSAWSGLAVGCGGGASAAGWLEGRLEVGSAGNVTLESSSLGIGLGRANGVAVQQGGAVSMSATCNYGGVIRYMPMVVGYAGGNGVYVLSNGTLTVTASSANHNQIFVGGCLSKDLNRAVDYACNVAAGGQSAVGALSVCGGTFSAANSDVVVGADGTGVFELAGSGVAGAGSLVISNQCAGTLAFAPGDAAAFPMLTVGNLTFAEGSKLKIDISRLMKPRSWTKLAVVSGEIGGQAPEVELCLPDGVDPSACQVEYERGGEKGIWLRLPPKGLSLIVR